jgi:vitamin B12 transporter
MQKQFFLLIKVAWLILIYLTPDTGEVAAQSITDTIYQIPDVVISASRTQYFRDDVKSVVFSQDEIKPFTGESLGHFIISNTALNVKAYGAGGTASVSLRGTSSSHFQVSWNGFPINSVTLGSADFSMIPAAGFDRISIVYGAPGALYGSGTFGGAINLDSDLKPEKALSGSANVNWESLKTIIGSASFHVGNSKLAWKVNVWKTHSDNEFTYYDYIRQSERKQTDGDWNDAGVIQHAVLKLSQSSTLEAGMWYQVKAYNIPSRIGSTSYESQKDSTLKLFAAYKKTASHWGLQVKAAYFNDEQSYTQKASAQSPVNSIESCINAMQFYEDANFRYQVRPYLSVDAGITGTYIFADVSSYGKRKEEKGLAAFTGLKYDRNRLSLQTEIRKEWNSNFNSGLLPSFGLAWKVFPDSWILRTNISKKFRKPTFNDLYWMPGGNPDLKPESGFSVEAGSLLTIRKKENTKLSTELSLYWSEIKDMIVWFPSGAYWMAKNYNGVRTAGMDANLLFDLQHKRLKYHSSLMVTLNHSVIKNDSGEAQEKMLYSPRVITSWENRFSRGIFDFTLWHHFTADRFYGDNSLLAPYQIFNIRAGVIIPVSKGKLGIHFTVNNLTNTTYELIRLYPMPGRNWSVKMSYTF